MNKRLWVTLSIALLGASAQGAVPPSQIEKIEILIEDGNWVELRAFLVRNPSLLRGNDALSEELRQFMTDTENLFTALVFEDSLFPDMTISPDTPARGPVDVATDPAPAPTPAVVRTTRRTPAPAPAPEVPVIKEATRTVVEVGRDDDDDDDRRDQRTARNTSAADDPLNGPGVNLAAPSIY